MRNSSEYEFWFMWSGRWLHKKGPALWIKQLRRSTTIWVVWYITPKQSWGSFVTSTLSTLWSKLRTRNYLTLVSPWQPSDVNQVLDWEVWFHSLIGESWARMISALTRFHIPRLQYRLYPNDDPSMGGGVFRNCLWPEKKLNCDNQGDHSVWT